MSRLSSEEYKEAESYLIRYRQNKKDVENIRADIISLNATGFDESKGSNKISDMVPNKVIELDTNEQLKKALKEYRLVNRVLEYVSEKACFVFKEFYENKKTRWEVMSMGVSERTFERKKRELVYAIHNEIKNF